MVLGMARSHRGSSWGLIWERVCARTEVLAYRKASATAKAKAKAKTREKTKAKAGTRDGLSVGLLVPRSLKIPIPESQLREGRGERDISVFVPY